MRQAWTASLLGNMILILVIFILGSQKDMVTPAPSNQLAELLEYQKVEDATSGNLVVVIPRYPVPMQAFQGGR
jgi:hypothetical protein